MLIIFYDITHEEHWVKYDIVYHIALSEEYLRIILDTDKEQYVMRFLTEDDYNDAYDHLLDCILNDKQFADLSAFQHIT